jgi:hypothetical protein
MSSITTGKTDAAGASPAVTWACLAFVMQTLIVGGPLFVQAGKLEARVATIEGDVTTNKARLSTDQEKYTTIIDRLARIETTQRQILDAIDHRPR